MAESYLDMIFRTKKEGNANKAVADELGQVKDKGKSAGEAFEMLTGSSLSAAGAFGVLAGGLKYAIGAAMESEKIQADLNATLTSTKGAAGLSADEINRMAGSLSEMSGVEDDAIVKAQAMLLTFTNIGKDVFPMATEAMVNMGAKFGSMDAAAIQLGKALNDPIKGVSALSEVGVAFTQVQKDQITQFVKMGDVASAQKVILKELNVEFGGLAAAMGQTTEGKINRLKNALGNLAETIGGKLIPFLGDAADALNLLLTATDKIRQVEEQHKQTIEETSATYADYVREILILHAKQTGLNFSTEEIDAMMLQYADDLEDTSRRMGGVSEATYNATQTTRILKQNLDEARSAAITAGGGMDEFASSVGSASLANKELSDWVNIAAEANKTLNDAALSLINDSMKPLTTEMLYQKAAVGLDSDAALELARSMGLINDETYTALSKLSELRTQFDSNKDGMIDATEAAKGFTDAVQTLAYGDYLVKINADFTSLERALGIADALLSKLSIIGPSIVGVGDGKGNLPIPVPVTPTPKVIVPPDPGPDGQGSRWGNAQNDMEIMQPVQSYTGNSVVISNVTISNAMDMETFKRMLMEAMGR